MSLERPSFGRRSAAVGLSIAIVVVLAADGFILTQRRVTTRVSLRDAVSRLHHVQGQALAPESKKAPAPAPTTVAPAGGVHSAVTTRAPTGQTRQAPTPTAPAPPASTEPYAVPPEGVYAYATTGGESISLGGASHKYPSETYASVHHLGGCQWQNENDVIKEHVDTRTLCGEPGRFSQLAQGRHVTFFGQTDGADDPCQPPLVEHEVGEAPGTTLSGTCADSSTSAAVAVTYVGHQQRTIGGVAVDAVHLQLHTVITGRAHGTQDETFWILSTNGLVLEWDRSIDTVVNATFGANVRYREQATFVLESLTPRGT